MEILNNKISSKSLAKLKPQEMKPILSLFTRTWNKDSHGLFDYEEEAMKLSLLLIQSSATIIRRKNEVREEETPEQEDSYLFSVQNSDDAAYLSNTVKSKFEVTEENINLLMNKMWYIIPSQIESTNKHMQKTRRNKEYQIRPYDVIKLGRVKYSVNEIKFISGVVEPTQEPVFDLIYKSFTPESNYECRYCLMNQNDDKNPLVSLCRCKGGATFIHYKCVKQWMSMKLSEKENMSQTVKSYNFKSFNCEICKYPYPCKLFILSFQYSVIHCKKQFVQSY